MFLETNKTGKLPKVGSKSLMAVGPTLHYSHKNVVRYWLFGLLVFSLSCLFWTRIVSGFFWSFSFSELFSFSSWRIGRFVIGGGSIFEHPWQILVLGIMMGILGVVPMLISQLMSFRYSILYIFAVFLLADLSGFAIFVLVSCVAVASRRLRFRSRFTSIALCMAPQLVYWGIFGGSSGVEPIKWGFSFTPWICAWLVGLCIAGVILGIGHYTRYRPGLVWVVSLVFLVVAFFLFEWKTGFDELDYQLYVAKNNPEWINEFHDHDITSSLDTTIRNPAVKKYLFAAYFYPKDEILLRKQLKSKIQSELRFGRWPSWFIVPDSLRYQQRRHRLFEQYDKFIALHPDSSRMPIALYYRGLLSEYSPDIPLLGQKEILHFYSDYPFERSREVWYRLYEEFPESPESAEARWRIACHWAGQLRFARAAELLDNAQEMVTERLRLFSEEGGDEDTFFSPFRSPADSVMTKSKIEDLQRRIKKLRMLISAENHVGGKEAEKMLAEFVMLNPHSEEYSASLARLLESTGKGGGLRDNILLAQAKLIEDEQLRAEKLNQLHNGFNGRDGGIESLYELSLLKRRLWSQVDKTEPEQKKNRLLEARKDLTGFIELYPESIFAEQAKKNLESLPTVE